MNAWGLTDSIASLVGQPTACPACGGGARLVNGTCVSCLLQQGLTTDAAEVEESLEALLTRVDIRDTDWRIGGYDILEEIGRGGMGVIYKARQRHSRRIVALKRVLAYHTDSTETVVRFRREAEAAASLDHPNVLPIYEVGEAEGLPFFTMKFAPGGSLHQAKHVLRENPRHCVWLIARIARAVHYAHSQGILHRDLKPGNILLDGWREPMVSDFGLAKWLDATSDLTQTLTVFGTPGYIAPEQANGPSAAVGPAADIYSLGAILFDLLTGRPPFLGEHALAVMRQAYEKPAPRLRTLIATADRDLETICARGLDRDPADRYRSAEGLANDLERWLEGREIVARPVRAPIRVWRWGKRNRTIAALILAVTFASAAITARELSRRKLERAVHAEQLAARSVAVLPLLNLDTIKPDEGAARAITSILRQEMTRSAPATVLLVEGDNGRKFSGATSDIQNVSRALSVRTVLSGTVRNDRGRVRISLNLKEGATGQTLLRRVVESDGPVAVGEVARSIAAGFSDQFQSARETYASEIEDPAWSNTTAREFLLAGRELANRRSGQDVDRAIVCFERAIAAEPRSSVAHAFLAMACVGRCSFQFDRALLDKAEVAATTAIQLGTARGEAHRAMAMVLHSKGNLQRAQEEIYAAMDVEGFHERLASNLGGISVTMGRPDRAILWAQIASQWQSRPAAYEHVIGDCLVVLGLDDRAAAAYRRVADLQPEMPEGWIGLCRLRLLQGDGPGAEALWLANQARYDRFELARQMGAQIEFFTGNLVEAKRLYGELAAAAPDGGAEFYGAVSYKSALGAIMQQTGDIEAGREILRSRLTALREMLELTPQNARVLYELSAVESSLGLPDLALQHFAAAASHGWLDYRSAMIDPRFATMRADPTFRGTVDAMQQRAASLRSEAVQ